MLNLLLSETRRGRTLFGGEGKDKRNLKLAFLVACWSWTTPPPHPLLVKWKHLSNTRLPAWEGGLVLDWVREQKGDLWLCGVAYTEIRASVPGGGSRRRKGTWCQLPIWQKPCSSLPCKSQSSRWWRAAVPGPAHPPPPCAGSASRWGGWRMCRSRAWRPAVIRILLPPARNTCSSHPLRSLPPVMRTLPGPTVPHPVPPRAASASFCGSGCVSERRRSAVRAGRLVAISIPCSPKQPLAVGRACWAFGVALQSTLSSPSGWNG